MKQRTLFDELQLAIKGDGKIENQSSNPLVVRAEGDISQITESVEELERLINTHVPEIQHELVTTEFRLNQFLEKVIKNKVVAIDTETNPVTRTPNGRLDPIAGFSAYTPGESAIYVPIDHDFFEGNIDARYFFRHIHGQGEKVAILMHNSNYDVPVIESYAQVRLRMQVDTLIAGRVLNENERQDTIPGSGYSLDYLWNRYVMGGKWSMNGSYTSLFNSRKFGSLNPELVYKYASMDAVMTYQLAQFQMKYLSTNSPELKKQPDLKSVSEYFWSVEMPVLRIAQEMSSRGINYDLERNVEVQRIYEDRLRNLRAELLPMIDDLLEQNKHRIPRTNWAQLDSPVNINSTTQIAVVLYDALGMELNDSLKKQQEVKARKSKSKNPVNYRFTGSEAISYFKEAYPEHSDFLGLFSTYKEEEKIYNTFIVKYREHVNKYTGKIHTEWNTLGADTGRMSSKSPNLYCMEVIKFIKLLGHLARS